MPRVFFTEKFVSQFEDLAPKIQAEAYRKIELFRENPKHPPLRCHKLHGPLNAFFSFSVNQDFRIVLEFGKGGEAYFLKIGNHDVYQ